MSEDTPISLPEDQCVLAQNVEFVKSKLGERRKGSLEIDLTGSGLEACNRVTFLFRHTPTSDVHDDELWALGVIDDNGSGESVAVLRMKTIDGDWETISSIDDIDVGGTLQFDVVAQALHGKAYVAFASSENRLHVRDIGSN
jgi:hypothetical protein